MMPAHLTLNRVVGYAFRDAGRSCLPPCSLPRLRPLCSRGASANAEDCPAALAPPDVAEPRSDPNLRRTLVSLFDLHLGDFLVLNLVYGFEKPVTILTAWHAYWYHYACDKLLVTLHSPGSGSSEPHGDVIGSEETGSAD